MDASSVHDRTLYYSFDLNTFQILKLERTHHLLLNIDLLEELIQVLINIDDQEFLSLAKNFFNKKERL